MNGFRFVSRKDSLNSRNSCSKKNITPEAVFVIVIVFVATKLLSPPDGSKGEAPTLSYRVGVIVIVFVLFCPHPTITHPAGNFQF